MDEAQIRSALKIHGRNRARARERADLESKTIAALVPAAVMAGIPKRQVAELAQISRPALDEMLRKHEQ